MASQGAAVYVTAKKKYSLPHQVTTRQTKADIAGTFVASSVEYRFGNGPSRKDFIMAVHAGSDRGDAYLKDAAIMVCSTSRASYAPVCMQIWAG